MMSTHSNFFSFSFFSYGSNNGTDGMVSLSMSIRQLNGATEECDIVS